jgi:hypothetical protein
MQKEEEKSKDGVFCVSRNEEAIKLLKCLQYHFDHFHINFIFLPENLHI